MYIDLKGRVGLVTGGGRNIGKEVVRQLAEHGASVAVAYQQDADAAAAVCAEVREAGGVAKSFRLDARDVPGIAVTVADVERELGPIDILVNNAAMRPRTKIADITPQEWDDVHATNLRGPFFLAQAVIPGMRARGWGRIVNVSGLDAYWGNPQRPHVVASKLGIIGLSRALANETGRWGITVNTVVPGTIDTDRPRPEWYANQEQMYALRVSQVPVARLGQAAEVAAACLFLMSDAAAYMTAQELRVTGGAYPIVRQPVLEYE